MTTKPHGQTYEVADPMQAMVVREPIGVCGQIAIKLFEIFEEARIPKGVAKAQRVIRKVRAGITWINAYHPTYNEAPWGGYKQSGIGRELGTFGFEEYAEVKQININLNVEPVRWFAELSDCLFIFV